MNATLTHGLVLLLASWVAIGCSATTTQPEKPLGIDDLRASSTTVVANTDGGKQQSEIPGQLNDGGWVVNVPGQPHTHSVVLSDCPDRAVVTRHVHEDDKSTPGEHKHNGCFVCPPA